MKKKILICTIVILVILVIIVAIIMGILKNKNKDIYTYTQSEIALDNENEYIVTTNAKWITMQNDGGSHINIYYEIDLNENTIVKCADKYVGFKGYEYERKIVSTKKINDVQKNELKLILNDAIKNETDKGQEVNFDFYVISSFNNKGIKIYDKNTINSIKAIVETENGMVNETDIVNNKENISSSDLESEIKDNVLMFQELNSAYEYYTKQQ